MNYNVLRTAVIELNKVSKRATIRKSIQSSTTPDPGHHWENEKTQKHHAQESQDQPFSQQGSTR